MCLYLVGWHTQVSVAN